MITRLLAASLFLLAGSIGDTSTWWDVRLADAQMDLVRARSEALRIIETDSQSLESIAVASWWLESMGSLPKPGEILETVTPPINPEMAFVLGLIEGELTAKPPAGALTNAELSGPWGTFGRLDLDRDVVPSDSDLPPLGTAWGGPGTHYRVQIASEDGRISVPPSLHLGGVVLAAWTIEASAPIDGFLVMEAQGSLKLEVDGIEIDTIRFAGLNDPGVSWFRVNLAKGWHRLRVAMSPQAIASVRLSLFDDEGGPVVVGKSNPPVEEQLFAKSTITPTAPPTPSIDLGTSSPARELLLSSEIAQLRGNTSLQKSLLNRALLAAPEEPMVHLAVGSFCLFQPTGEAPEIVAARAADHFRKCRELPSTGLLERILANRQNRIEDAERIQDLLLESYPSDARVLRLRITQAVRRGWPQEAADALQSLETILGPTESVQRLRLQVLEGLEHWTEYQNVLHTQAAQPPLRRASIGQLADGCSTDSAIDLIEELRTRVLDPDLDADRIRLLLRSERPAEARKALDEALDQWGVLPNFSGLDISLALGSAKRGDPDLAKALDGFPGDLDLLTLAWRRGVVEPFWAPFFVDATEVAGSSSVSEEGVDAVLLLDQAVERVFSDGSSLYYYHGLSKALTPAGARRVSGLEQMPGAVRIKLAIIKPDGQRIVPAEITPTSRGINLGEVEAGDLIEEEYVAPVSAISANVRAHLSPYVYRFADSDRAFGHSEYILVHPSNVELAVEGFFTGVESTIDSDGELTVRRWRSNNVPATPNEPFGPPAQELLPWVAYGFGADWQTVGDNLRDRLIPVIRSTPELRLFADQHLQGETPGEQLRSLAAALLETVEPGNTILDLGVSAGASLSRGQGNRIGVLASLLLGAGWEVDMALARPAPFANTHLAIPSADAFTLPVLRIRRESSKFWVDLHEEISGIDHISPILQGSDALILPLGNPAKDVFLMSELPTFPNPNLEERTTMEAVINADGGAEIVFTMWLRDAQATRFAENLRSVPSNQKETAFARMASGLFPGAENVRGEVQQRNDQLEVRFSMDISDACVVQGNAMECRGLNSATSLAPTLASLSERQQPLILQLPILRREEVTIQPPPGWTSDRPERRISTSWGRVDENLEIIGSRQRSTLVLEIPAVTVKPDDYPQFARFCRAIDELISRPPRFER